ncbi:protein ALP1-like, partial [Astyanax mexicanus]
SECSLRNHHGWGPTIEVLVFLFWLASGASYRVVSRAFSIPKTTVCRIVHRVSEELMGILSRVICVPATAEEQQEIGQGFERLSQNPALRKARGAIDGCHIRIKAPEEPDTGCYRNRKLFTSIQLQAVCDHRARFLDVYIGFPGSVHDSRVLKHNGGYPCLQRPLALITPYKRPLRDERQRVFNRYHSKARSVIERAFGIMKTRWRSIFLKALEVHPSFVPTVVASCAILHNICLGAGDELPPEEDCREEDTESEEGVQDTSNGNALREERNMPYFRSDGYLKNVTHKLSSGN